ncbi:MAG: hypothetical protein PHW04_15300, partial [Candidatus Wallbacteria bacterium]|nr:hypothetical protein [Candidatus Wallbacteria bacterium]
VNSEKMTPLDLLSLKGELPSKDEERNYDEAPRPLRLSLAGISFKGMEKVALIKHLDLEETYEMHAGDRTADFQLLEIGDDRVTIFAFGLNMKRTLSVDPWL